MINCFCMIFAPRFSSVLQVACTGKEERLMDCFFPLASTICTTPPQIALITTTRTGLLHPMHCQPWLQQKTRLRPAMVCKGSVVIQVTPGGSASSAAASKSPVRRPCLRNVDTYAWWSCMMIMTPLPQPVGACVQATYVRFGYQSFTFPMIVMHHDHIRLTVYPIPGCS